MWTDRWMDKRTKNGQTNGLNYTNFERNLAMMVIYVPVKFEFDCTNCFLSYSPETKMWMDRWMDRQTDKRNYTNFERNLAMMVIYVPIKFEFDWTNRFRVRVRKRKCGRTDGWTDKKRTNEQTELHQFRK